jgi:copper chaperone CopZ
MTHTYKIEGMTCTGCVARVKEQLLKLPAVLSAEVKLDPGEASISMSRHIPLATLKEAVGRAGHYQIEGTQDAHAVKESSSQSWLQTYKPLLIVFAFITSIAWITAYAGSSFNAMDFMNHFMAGFFIAFSFFKFLDLKGFAGSYAMYDLIAARIPVYGYVYPFIEAGLGFAYLLDLNTYAVNMTTLVVMALSSVGVVQSVVQKREIRCACLGTVFNLPISTVTIIENGLMMIMAFAMLFSI